MDIKDMFYERPDKLSWTRIMMSIIIFVALIIALSECITAIYIKDFDIHETLILSMLGIATGGKITQKFTE